MTEEVQVQPTMPECNGSVATEKGPRQGTEVIDERAKPAGTAPCLNTDTSLNTHTSLSTDTSLNTHTSLSTHTSLNTDTSLHTPPAGENQQEERNSLAQDRVDEHVDGEKQCKEKQEDSGGTLQQGPADTQDTELAGQGPEEGLGSEETSVSSGELGLAATPDREVVETPTASADGRGNTTEEEEEEAEEEEEEDTEEDEVQVIDIKTENSEVSHRTPPGGGKEASPPTSPGRSPSQAEPGREQPSPGKKNDISRHSYSRYNTISYRRIRKGNTKQRIDEFESMMHL